MALISNGDQILTKNVYGTDETVLWEGLHKWWNSNTLTVSENITNFEKIGITFKDDWLIDMKYEEFPTVNNSIDLVCQGIENAKLVFKTVKLAISNNTLTLLTGGKVTAALADGTIAASTDKYVAIVKIVGINRKQTATQEGV